MKKRIEDMTQEEVLREFEGARESGRVRRNDRKLLPLTIRVPPELVVKLSEQARKEGVSGHTTMARILLESSLGRPRPSLVDEVADAVVRRLRRTKRR